MPGLFEALACDNPYPASCFPDAAFYQLVARAERSGFPLDRIVGLDRRKNRIPRA